eukprot:CAMPEP_0168616760 /NCGR_PEP_ID=MMETSP0449_2-20121227/5192_1 /TAXON_ID=1082188 /ORGANISM="Strombidium rassoulzadegani, Strain ras09" /LENGTH=163 /DNA_ID=CAMNT_0008657553 /DNA_START=271 /DNA_END=759 /DNA_ORIENTATION=-
MSYQILSERLKVDFAKECNSQTGKAHQIDMIYSQGQKILCSEDCPCKVQDKEKFDEEDREGLVTSPSGYTQYLDCPNEELSDSHESKYVAFLKTLEGGFDCAGMCELPEKFLFSDVSKGSPTLTCKEVVSDYITENTQVYVGCSLTAGFLGILGLLLSVSVCY